MEEPCRLPGSGARRRSSNGSEMGGDVGGVRAWTVSIGKSVRAAGLEIRVFRSCARRRRSVVPVDRETGPLGRSFPDPARQYIRHTAGHLRAGSSMRSPISTPQPSTPSLGRFARSSCRTVPSAAPAIGCIPIERAIKQWDRRSTSRCLHPHADFSLSRRRGARSAEIAR